MFYSNDDINILNLYLNLKDAVFSDKFTGSVSSTRKSFTTENISIERMTYLALYSKIQKDKDENLDNVVKKLEESEKL